jgi:uncharacterized protein YuzE
MCYDPQSDAIYVLGRYVNSPEDNLVMLQPDLFKYSLKDDSWIKLSSNTAVSAVQLREKNKVLHDLYRMMGGQS